VLPIEDSLFEDQFARVVFPDLAQLQKSFEIFLCELIECGYLSQLLDEFKIVLINNQTSIMRLVSFVTRHSSDRQTDPQETVED
jgi:hypothetical protein